MNGFRTLRADEIECRIAMVKIDQKTHSKSGVSVLLYKTARTDADLLDETVGPDKWQNDFKLIDGVLYGGIGVDYGNGLVWKWDAGTESNTEAEKGRASDAFKRAGFKHGIGRELYSAPFIWINASKLEKLNGNKCYDRFDVASIGYNESRKINHLIIQNQRGDIVFEMGSPAEIIPETPAVNIPPLICTDCGRPITDAKRRDGTVWPAEEIAIYTERAYQRPLCVLCGKAAEKRAANESPAT